MASTDSRIRGVRVLIAEDDRDIRTFVEMTLSDDHALTLVADGAEALGAVRDGGFDAAVIDVMMPQVNGLDVVRAIRNDRRLGAIPVILLTARVEEDDHIRGFEAGADRYITKPFDSEQLVDALQELLDTPVERRVQERAEQLRQAQFVRTLERRF